ncbi:MAG: Fe-S cluster assembly ATPase SufC [Erysipelotrichaceae bacterium]
MSSLVIKNLYVAIDGKEILKGIDLVIKQGETHVLLGPNGNGKSTLLQTIMGHPKYQVTQGEIKFNDQDVLNMSVDQRSKVGLFLGMQYPVEVSGVTNSDFLRAAMNARAEKPVPLFKFIKEMESAIKDLELKSELAHRFLNEGFSGGEKKRNEIVHMQILKPEIAMLDEIDSGLDVDALNIVAKALQKLKAEINMSLLVVTHYKRFTELLNLDFVHVMIDGQIVCSGDLELAEKIDSDGYDWLLKEKNLKLAAQPKKKLMYSLGTCAVKDRV